MRVHVGTNRETLRGNRRRTHETSTQDYGPDRRINGHICSGSRSKGSRRGRRPAHPVPTQINQLLNNPADVVNAGQAVTGKVTKVTLQ